MITMNLTPQGLQKLVANFVAQQNLDASVSIRSLDLVSEIGELMKEYIVATSYGKKEFRPTAGWEAEFGDVLFTLVCLANLTNIDIENSLNKTMKRYENRLTQENS